MRSSEARYAAFERIVPTGVRRFARPVIGCPESLDQFLRYVAIGVVTAAVDFTALRFALTLEVPRRFAICLGLLLSNITEFFLNRRYNFRAFDRAVHEQFGKFALTAACTWSMTLAGVELFVRFAHFPPLLAKFATIPFTLPISFLASRHVIFAPRSAAATGRGVPAYPRSACRRVVRTAAFPRGDARTRVADRKP